jgi:DNA polymerase-3 subunit epsilon
MIQDSSIQQHTLFDFPEVNTQPLSSGFPDKMVLLDCETTGGKPTYHRITEIGLLIIENGEIVDTWQSFIQPDQSLPANIQQLTGITPQMLANAPRFEEVADVLLSKLEGRVLVAHNARFDYGFLKNEFSRTGISYTSKPLCSVKFSRALYPQFKRHGLDQIINRFKLQVLDRHRAFDDAKLIYDFFQHSSQLFSDEDIEAVCAEIQEKSSLPTQLNPKVIDNLPKQPGVYYFYDDKGKLLYVGKSVNIRQRVLSHFSQDYKNHKDLKMSSRIADVSFEITGSDFSAQLLESREIKQLVPLYNHRLRKLKKLYRLMIETNDQGYAIPVVKEQQLSGELTNNFGLFRSYRQIESKLKQLADDYQLCFRLLGLEGKNTNGTKACFRHQLRKCNGACCGKESVSNYNARLKAALNDYQQKVWPWSDAILLEETTNAEQPSHFHLIKDWVYLGKLISENELFEWGYQVSAAYNQQHSEVTEFENSSLSIPVEQFDLDTYFILIRFLLNPKLMTLNGLKVHPLIALNSNDS